MSPHFCTKKYFLTKRNYIDDPVLILSPNMLNELCFYEHKIKIRLIYKYCSRFLFTPSFNLDQENRKGKKKENLDFLVQGNFKLNTKSNIFFNKIKVETFLRLGNYQAKSKNKSQIMLMCDLL